MSRFLILLALVGLAVWWLFGRRRADDREAPVAKKNDKAQATPQAMVACAHCAVHLPQAEALLDPQGRLFCSEAHRLAGPR